MPRLSVFIACSLDGYIATEDDSLDWLDRAAAPDEDYGYDEFIATVDALAMGRGTYDYICHVDPLPFGDRPVYVFTHRWPGQRAGVTFWDLEPHAAVAAWEAEGLTRVYVDGGSLISAFLAEGLIDDMTITIVPTLLGSGRRLFHPRRTGTDLTLTGVKHWPSGLVNLSYLRFAP
jgi:dihydrofolate reductase